MLRTKSKSRLWALALLCLVALTAVALGVMASRIPATAETTTPLSERETEWLKPYGFKQAEEADQIDGVVLGNSIATVNIKDIKS